MFDPERCYDVAVIGGGLCGFAAARLLALHGSRVVLVERRPVLGWEATWAFHTELDGRRSDAARWLVDALAAAGGRRGRALDPPVAETLLDGAAASLGIDLLLYAQPVALGQHEGRVAAVVLGTKAGELPVRAKAFIDATENAILWQLAGSALEWPEGCPARHTLFLNCCQGLDLDEPRPLHDLPGEADVVLRPTPWPGEVAVDFGIQACDVRRARRALPNLLRTLREHVAGLDHALVTAVGTEPYPLATARVGDAEGCRHASLPNLYGAIAWVGWGPQRPACSTLDDRLALGEAVAHTVVAQAMAGVLGEVTELDSPAPLPHSRVAPPVHEADVVVCGGGTGGALAAIAAARQGARTVVLEAATCLGGIGTGGGIHSYYHGVAGGIQDDVDALVAELAPLFGPSGGFHPEAKKVALELLAAEAGVQVVYNTTITGAQTTPAPSRLPATADAEPPRLLEAVVAAGPGGNALYKAKAFVDATGDGDLAAMAGAQFTFGREADGLPHAYSLPAGRISGDGKLLITNFDAGYCDPTDAVDLTRARRRALGHYRQPTYQAPSRFVYIAPILGLRNSRQVVGDYRLTLADEIAGREFPDVIAYAFSHFDNHGFDYENESDEAMLWVWLLGYWGRRIGCEIPYRTLLPRGIDGLLMGCRALSLTHDAHNQLRMQRDLQRIGEAAGVAAALAAAKGLTPRELPIGDLQAALLASGALGPREQPRLPEPQPEPPIHDPSWVPAQPPALPLAERAAQLGTENAQEAAWELLRSGDDALPLLLDAVNAEKPATRFWASVALAMLGRPEAAPELRAALAERRAEVPEGRKTAPLWRSAAVLLGRIADEASVPQLCDVLTAPDADLDAIVAAVRALGRIADPTAAPAIAALADRADLPDQRVFQVSGAGINPVRENARWQIDLAAAEALARLGSPRPDIPERHLADDRAYVRRHAQRIAQLTKDRAEPEPSD